MTISKTLTATVSSFVAMALLPAIAATRADNQEKSREISIAGYDLNNAEHAKIVLDNIRIAAAQVCETVGDRRTLREHILRRKCRAEAVSRAVTALNAPVVEALIAQSAD